MYSVQSLLVATTLFAAAFASPTARGKRDNGECLTYSDASYLATGYGSLLSAYTEANSNIYLMPEYTEQSDSINVLAGIPAGQLTFPSRDAFEASQSQLDPIPFTLISIDAVDCTSFVFRWSTQFGQADLPVQGINIATAAKNSNGWQIQKQFVEFNSINWDKNVGGSVVIPAERK